MKLVLIDDQNTHVQIKEIKNLSKDSDCLFFFLKIPVRGEDIERIEEVLSHKIGCKAVVLDSMFHEMILAK